MEREQASKIFAVFKNLEDLVDEEASEAGLRLARAQYWERNGFPEIAAIIRNVAMRELEHFVLVTSYAKRHWVEEDLRSALQDMMAADDGSSVRERQMASVARQLGLNEEADLMERLSRDEAEHVKQFEEALVLLQSQGQTHAV